MNEPPTPGNAAPLPIVILISGRGTNMQAIAARATGGTLPVQVRAVVSDKPAAAGLALARSLGIHTEVLAAQGFVDRAAYDAALSRLIERFEPGLIVLAGFMRILSPAFIQRWHDRIVNIHPSLLPRHRGLHTHRRVLEAGETVHGASVHFVTEELDGGPVIVQSCVEVSPQDTEQTLSARVQREEHTIYPQAIEWFAQGRLRLRGHSAWLDGQPLERPVMIDARGRETCE